MSSYTPSESSTERDSAMLPLSATRPRRDRISSGVEITWLGQAGFVIRRGPLQIVIDPFLTPSSRRATEPPIKAEDLFGTNLVLCTHEHADHLDLETLRRISDGSPETLFAVPEQIIDQLSAAGIPQAKILPARAGELLAGAPLPVFVLPAMHGVTLVDAYTFGEYVGGSARFVSYHLRFAGVNIYHSGDTIRWPGQAERLAELIVDLALLPINGRDAEREGRGIVGNLEPSEAAQLAADAGARLLIPMHWDAVTGNLGSPSEVLKVIEELKLPLAVMVPQRGQPFWFG